MILQIERRHLIELFYIAILKHIIFLYYEIHILEMYTKFRNKRSQVISLFFSLFKLLKIIKQQTDAD